MHRSRFPLPLSLGRLARAALAAALMGLFLFGTVLETGCGSSSEPAPKKKKKKKKKPVYRDVLPKDTDEDKEAGTKKEPAVDTKDEERRVREAWEAKQKAMREQEKADAEARRKAAEDEERRKREEAEARAKAEAEKRKKAEEEARQKQVESQFLEQEIQALAEFEREVGGLAAKLKFGEAVERWKAFHEGLKTQGVKDLCWVKLDGCLAMKNVFEKMVSKLQPGVALTMGRDFTLVVEKADLDGVTGKVGR
ncbi:MAG: hypothetical protein ACYS47_11955, partial [Planctomycetota bacterium]